MGLIRVPEKTVNAHLGWFDGPQLKALSADGRSMLLREVGEQEIDESCGGALALNVKVCDAPFRAAVKIAV